MGGGGSGGGAGWEGGEGVGCERRIEVFGKIRGVGSVGGPVGGSG